MIRLALLPLVLLVSVGCGGAIGPEPGDDRGPCHDVPSCPEDGASCYLQADDAGRLVDLWTCPAEATGNTPWCFLAHGCHEEDPCVTMPGDGGALETCWILYSGGHPSDFYVCPSKYRDECVPTPRGDQ